MKHNFQVAALFAVLAGVGFLNMTHQSHPLSSCSPGQRVIALNSPGVVVRDNGTSCTIRNSITGLETTYEPADLVLDVSDAVSGPVQMDPPLPGRYVCRNEISGETTTIGIRTAAIYMDSGGVAGQYLMTGTSINKGAAIRFVSGAFAGMPAYAKDGMIAIATSKDGVSFATCSPG